MIEQLQRNTANFDSGEPRILITRLSAIGDCIQTLPVACALRERYPSAFIAWAVQKGTAPLVAACRAVDRVIVVPKTYLSLIPLSWNLRRLRIQITLDAQGLNKSSSIARVSGAARRIGFASPVGRELSPWLNNDLVVSRRVHMVERYLELLQPLGIENPKVEFGLTANGAADEWTNHWLALADLGGSFAVVNVGAGWDSKRWPAERLADVANHLGQRWNLPTVVVWAGTQELEMARQIAALAPSHAHISPSTTLLQLASLLRKARLMVASDTGPLHLAAAVGTPCIGLYGTTNREAHGPYGEGCLALQRAYDPAPNRKQPGADNWAVREITPQMVCDACDELLARQLHVSSEIAAACDFSPFSCVARPPQLLSMG